MNTYLYMNPFFTTLCNQMLSLAVGWNFQIFHPHQPQQPPIFCFTPLVDQPCSFVTKPNQASTRYSPDVFSSFYRTVTHGESHRIFTSLPQTRFPDISLQNLFLLLPPHFFSLQPSNRPPDKTQGFNRS